MNISEHVQKLRNWMEFKNYSPQSVKSYCSNFTCFLSHFAKQGITHPSRISTAMVVSFLSQFKEPATHSQYHSAIKIYYEKIAHIGTQKFKYIERPRKNSKLPVVLSVAEIQKMFLVCNNIKHKVILGLLYSCGLRVSELLNLKWQHIDRNRMVINIIQAKGKKDRQVMLTPALIPLLENYWKQYHSKEYVLNGQFQLQYTAKSIGEVIKHLAKTAGISKRVYTHLLRHCSFTHMVEAGTDINLVQKLAGHSSPKTTAIYTHISHNLISKIKSPLAAINLNL